jgi:putative transposase
MIRTIKLPLTGTINQEIMLETLRIAAEVYNLHATYGFDNECWSKKQLHKQLYSSIRESYPDFPSALLQTIRDNVCESLKSMHENDAWQSAPRKKQYSSIRYDKRTCTLNLATGQVSLAWIGNGRLKATFIVPAYYQQYISWSVKSAQLVYRKDLKRFFLHVAVESQAPAVMPGAVLALDKGINTFIYASDGNFVDGTLLLSKREYYRKRRKELQRLSTRSAKRVLRSLSGREKRFAIDYVHCIVNQLIAKPYTAYAVEDLVHIRSQGKKKKSFNYKLSHWVYNKFDTVLTYKAEQQGKQVIKVSPRYTSQRCSLAVVACADAEAMARKLAKSAACGYIAKANRRGQVFKCGKCGFNAHADYNASLNILTAAVNQPNEFNRAQGVV